MNRQTWSPECDSMAKSRFLKALRGDVDDKLAAGRGAFRGYVLDRQHKKVPGWVLDGALATITYFSFFQHEIGVEGGACEIGVHHGRLFIALATLVRDDAPLLAVDVFENQDANIDKSGMGDREQFLANVRLWLGDNTRVTVLAADSLTISSTTILDQLGGQKVRIFSVDGGHTVAHVQNDITIAEGALVEGGIVVVDDFFNPHWPGVTEGVVRYFTSARAQTLVPICYGDNKLYLCDIGHAYLYRAMLKNALLPLALDSKDVELCGNPVLQLRMPPLDDILRSHSPVNSSTIWLGDLEVIGFTGDWHPAEVRGRWTAGKRSGVVLLVPSNRAGVQLVLRLSAMVSQSHPVTRISVLLDGAEIAAGKVRQEQVVTQISINIGNTFVQPLVLEFVTDFLSAPNAVGLSKDKRLLGVFVSDFKLETAYQKERSKWLTKF